MMNENNRKELIFHTDRFSTSILFPITTNGNLSASLGFACTKNMSRHDSKFFKLFGSVTSNTIKQQSAPR